MGIKFTTAEDAEVVRLKEQVGGSWKSIQQAFAAVFPGTTRKYNDLQVRYTRSLKPGEKFRAAALALGANVAPAPPLPAPQAITAVPASAHPPFQTAQAGGRASTRHSALSAATRYQSKVATRKTRSSSKATFSVTPSAPPPPPPPALPAPIAATEDPPTSPTESLFDPPTLEQIAAARTGDASVPLFPPHAFSTISDLQPPSASGIAARRTGNGGPITALYPPGSLPTAKADEVEEEVEEEEEETIQEEAPPARSLRSGVHAGHVAKKPAKQGMGGGKETESAIAPPAPKLKQKQELKERLEKIIWVSGSTRDYGWEDDRWADIAG